MIAATVLVALGVVMAFSFSAQSTPKVGLSARWDGARAVAAKVSEAVAGTASSSLPAWRAQPEVGPRRVAGRVTRRGAPVAKAHVQLMSWPDAQLIAATSTSGDGTFDFGTQPAVACTVAAASPGALDAHVYVDLRNPASALPSDQLELKLADCENHLRGHVFDTAGLPLEHAWVHLAEARGVETNAKGEYDLCFPDARLTVLVDAPGYAGWSKPITGRGTVEQDFRLAPEALVVGRVVEAETGAPVASALVFAKPGFRVASSDEGPRATQATTDVEGRFSVSVMPGTVLLFAQGAIGSSSQELRVAASVGHTNPPLTLQIMRQPTLRGVVRNDGRPIAGAGIVVRGTRQWAAAAVSQADGTFVVPRVPPGKLSLTAEPFSIVAASLAEMPPFDTTIELEVRPRAKVHGTVTTRTGEPVSDVWITAAGGERSDDSMNNGGGTSDANGRYSIEGLSAGRWTIAGGRPRDSVAPREDVVLVEGDDREVDLVFTSPKRGMRVSGRLVTEAGAAVGGVVVMLSTERSTGCGARSQADGTFHCEVGEGGTYQVRTALPLVGPAPSVTVAEGSQVEGVSVVVVDDRTRLLGQVVDGEGSPVPDVLVRVQEQIAQRRSIMSGMPLTTTITDPQGRFAVEGRKGHRYFVEATPTDGSTKALAEVIADEHEATISFATSGSIDGDLVGFGTPPEVRAVEADNRWASWASVTGTAFTMRVAPGRYAIIAANKADMATAEVEVKAGERVRLKLTTRGTGALQGSVITAATHEPVRGMACTVSPVSGYFVDRGQTHTDSRGQFVVDPAPVGEVVVSCYDTDQRFEVARVTTTVPTGGRGHATLEVAPRSLPRLPR